MKSKEADSKQEIKDQMYQVAVRVLGKRFKLDDFERVLEVGFRVEDMEPGSSLTKSGGCRYSYPHSQSTFKETALASLRSGQEK